MPRLARLDAVGVLQHVMVRGIEKCDIFIDDKDRHSFLDRLSTLLIKTNTACLAWVLMTNHLHLLLRPQRVKLSSFMRRLLTGYAVTFNKRHHRVGHLFQNRYKSIVCEEDPYLLELVRYIHLNPVRAGLVDDVEDLLGYPWSCHCVLMGRRQLNGQATMEVLSHFGETPKVAIPLYESFVKDAAPVGHREEFAGGGMYRSSRFLETEPGKEAFDERVLGSGTFVEQVCSGQEQQHDLSPALESVLQAVANHYKISFEKLCHPNKERSISHVRAVACFVAERLIGYSGVDIARLLNVTPSGVTVAAQRGETLIEGEDTKAILANIKISTTSLQG